jgi:hypothetical protein
LADKLVTGLQHPREQRFHPTPFEKDFRGTMVGHLATIAVIKFGGFDGDRIGFSTAFDAVSLPPLVAQVVLDRGQQKGSKRPRCGSTWASVSFSIKKAKNPCVRSTASW